MVAMALSENVEDLKEKKTLERLDIIGRNIDQCLSRYHHPVIENDIQIFPFHRTSLSHFI